MTRAHENNIARGSRADGFLRLRRRPFFRCRCSRNGAQAPGPDRHPQRRAFDNRLSLFRQPSKGAPDAEISTSRSVYTVWYRGLQLDGHSFSARARVPLRTLHRSGAHARSRSPANRGRGAARSGSTCRRLHPALRRTKRAPRTRTDRAPTSSCFPARATR